MDWSSAFAAARGYSDFMAIHATPEQKQRWDAQSERVVLSPEQQERLGKFKRRMPVLVLAGAWCGDCARQVPILQTFAQAASSIDLRFLDRDAAPAEVREAMKINGGHRVPAVLFLSEDHHPIVLYGETTLSGYRRKAESLTGCSIDPKADEKLLLNLTSEWLDQFERAHWILRLSPRLRQIHGD